MEILVTASLSKFPLPSQISKRHRKSAVLQFLNCSRNIGESNGLSKAPRLRELGSPEDVEQNHLKSIGTEKEVRKPIDIWQLFEEAQRNILSLNKQRLLAMEEVERLKNERNSLLDRIEQLEIKQPTARKDKLTICAELLLRIDALLLNGVIGSAEASDLRSLIIDLRDSLADNLYDIILKNDAEFLAELRCFTETRKGNGLQIIHICTEMSPVVSVGPLAPYITGLSCALRRKGNLVEVCLLESR